MDVETHKKVIKSFLSEPSVSNNQPVVLKTVDDFYVRAVNVLSTHSDPVTINLIFDAIHLFLVKKINLKDEMVTEELVYSIFSYRISDNMNLMITALCLSINKLLHIQGVKQLLQKL